MPTLLPWLAVLVLLVLKPNRCPSAWWVWLPLALLALAASGLETALDSGLETFTGTVLDVVGSLVFGLAAVWLLAPYLARSHRFVTFLCLLLALAVFGIFTFVARQDWSEAAIPGLQMGILLVVCIFVTSVAIALAGLACRGRYRAASLYLWMFVFLLGLWLVVTAPFYVIAAMVSSGRAPWLEFFCGILMLAGISFATVLPFLILSSANSFFRERLKALLHMERQTPPIIPAASPENPGKAL